MSTASARSQSVPYPPKPGEIPTGPGVYRFRDADPSNNDPSDSPGLFDRAKARYYHGGDFKGVIDRLPYAYPSTSTRAPSRDAPARPAR